MHSGRRKVLKRGADDCRVAIYEGLDYALVSFGRIKGLDKAKTGGGLNVDGCERG